MRVAGARDFYADYMTNVCRIYRENVPNVLKAGDLAVCPRGLEGGRMPDTF
ncbi:hypothetical protein L207DRAFT_594133 [Hyaloscypha variabilis F]|uniref:Uncharacterized protein n=1 Tax=Hyaloscypha variabilis (strain UAMH 11265 / GT02V1 / F) TaxID=1149755 RepID=A0A2J6QR45_HYAVF|nr:hypothetical protein L207DRAFT_594134 [Hyaloscypha variabilis F]PMD28736.1 hypothetical protein L207DRAFT_594133 [Hyaloscypha variabilis F]